MKLSARAAVLLVFTGIGCSDPAPPVTPPWATAFDAAPLGWLLNVWGPSPDDLYAVGGRAADALVMHYDGHQWARVNLGIESRRLHWIYGFGHDNLTAVGDQGTVVHWDGHTWTAQTTPTRDALWGVWGAAPNDLWAVGGSGNGETPPVLLHGDGSTWTAVQIPTLMRASVSAFFKVWGTGADNVYVVGQRGVVLHRTGGVWREELAGVSGDLVSIWGSDPSHILAVGGRGNALVSRWDGHTWTPRSLDPLPGLNGVWMRTPNVIHAVGVSGLSIRLDFNTLTPIEETVPTAFDLHSIFGDATGHLTTVGGSLGSATGPFIGVALSRPMLTTE